MFLATYGRGDHNRPEFACVEGLDMKDKENERFADYFGKSVRALSDYFGLGLQVAVSFALFVLGGFWADEKLGTSPLFLLVGIVVGMVGMVLLLMKAVNNANKKKR